MCIQVCIIVSHTTYPKHKCMRPLNKCCGICFFLWIDYWRRNRLSLNMMEKKKKTTHTHNKRCHSTLAYERKNKWKLLRNIWNKETKRRFSIAFRLFCLFVFFFMVFGSLSIQRAKCECIWFILFFVCIFFALYICNNKKPLGFLQHVTWVHFILVDLDKWWI